MNILTPLLMASGLQLAIFGILGLAVLVFLLVFISYIGLFVKSLLAGATAARSSFQDAPPDPSCGQGIASNDLPPLPDPVLNNSETT